MSIFDTEGGSGRTTEYAGEIVDAFYAENEYGTSFQVHTLLDHPEDFPWMADGTAKEFYNAGPGWSPASNGSTITRTDEKVKPNSNTELGRLWDQMKNLGAEKDLAPRGTPLDASFWKGLRFRFGAVEWKTNAFTAKDGTAIEAKVKVKAMPVEYLGTKGAAVTNGHNPEAFDLSTLNVDAATLTALTDAATKADSFSKFLPVALGLGLDQAVFAVVSNPSTGPQVYAALKPF